MAAKKKATKKKAAKKKPERRAKADSALRVTVRPEPAMRGEVLRVYEVRVQGCGSARGEIVLGRLLARDDAHAKRKALSAARKLC